MVENSQIERENRIMGIRATNIKRKVNLGTRTNNHICMSENASVYVFGGKSRKLQKQRIIFFCFCGTSTIQNLMVRKFWLFYFENGSFLLLSIFFFVFALFVQIFAFVVVIPLCLHFAIYLFRNALNSFSRILCIFQNQIFSSGICFGWSCALLFV